MLTRIEIDGFKSFANFALDLNPFTVILGQNGSGKSNLFDAMQLLRRAVSEPLAEALRGGRGEFRELFRVRGDGKPVDRMRFAVEVLIRRDVDDSFQKRLIVGDTRLRYELEIERRPDPDELFPDAVVPDLVPFVSSETATVIPPARDVWAATHQLSEGFRTAYMRYSGQEEGPLLSTEIRPDGGAVFTLTQGGRRRHLSARSAESTVLSSITTATENPVLYALRREIESWRTLHLDPAALRRPSDASPRSIGLTEAGENLPAVLRRIEAAERSTEFVEGSGALMADLVADFSHLIRGITGVELIPNPATGEWEVRLRGRDLGTTSARVASDGTLRVLAVLAALYDPASGGLLCFEEPENGIHPERLRDFITVVRDLVTDPAEDLPGAPLMQALLSSHSPLLLLTADPADVVVFDWVSRWEPDLPAASRITRVRRLVEQREGADAVEIVSAAERGLLTGISSDEVESLLGA